ncbi:hypothetical protein Lal_00004232 [Lupinus albus]|nr:hypothetical protein Lal_00004232 [Lupinus albus]
MDILVYGSTGIRYMPNKDPEVATKLRGAKAQDMYTIATRTKDRLIPEFKKFNIPMTQLVMDTIPEARCSYDKL